MVFTCSVYPMQYLSMVNNLISVFAEHLERNVPSVRDGSVAQIG